MQFLSSPKQHYRLYCRNSKLDRTARRKGIIMNKTVSSVIAIRNLEANTPDNPHDEPAIQLAWDEYAVAILILKSGPSVHLFSHDEDMQDILLTYWSEIDMRRVAEGIYEEEGLEGLIEICRFFLEKLAEHFTKAIEKLENQASA